MDTFNAVGKPTPLMDGSAKVTGSLRFTGDLQLPGLLYARMVLSPYAHANIRKIDKTMALAVPGVVAVLTASDLPDVVPIKRSRLLLARDRVIFVGQPVALVLATGEDAAEDALDLVQIDYEPLPAAISIDEALAPDAPLVWQHGIPSGQDDSGMHGAGSGSEVARAATPTNIARQFDDERGDIETGFAEADLIVERTFSTSVVHQSYLEPHSVMAEPDLIHNRVTIWSSTQGQFPVREEVADVLGIPEVDVRVIGMPVGGGFGGKIILYEPLVALAARAVGRPVRLVLTRMDELHAGNPAPGARIWLRIGAKVDGSLTALHARITIDCGCYGYGMAGSMAFLLGSLYRLPSYRLETTEVLTFKTSTDSYRAPGAPPADFAVESLMNELADGLGLDHFDIRLKNASRPDDLRADDKPWGSTGMVEVLEALREHPAWQEREIARAAGRGVGIAVGGWTGGVEPTAAICMVDGDGFVTINIGSADISGSATSLALLAAEVLGVPVQFVRVNLCDTSSAPYAGVAAGSKITFTVGTAVMEAAKEACKLAIAIAADELEAHPGELMIANGIIQVIDDPNRAISLGEAAAKGLQWDSMFGPIIAHGRRADPQQAPGFCAQLAEVEVDEETGEVHVHRLVIAQDTGKAINPLAVEGQMHGGSTQGLGWALYERIAYSEEGQVLSGSWMDYAVPKSTQAAKHYETIIVEVPIDHGPFGARGVGEPPIIPTAAAVASAITDATRVRLARLPMTPPVVLEALLKRD